MTESFKEDFFWMLKEGKGYFPWVEKSPYRLARHLRGIHGHRLHHCDREPNARELVRAITNETVHENALFDLLMRVLVRAEIRMISRFIPQRSHEERLTGNLVSEIDNAISMIRPQFRKESLSLYGDEKDIDFFYYDLSRGGKIEKETGADLGVILVVDLPDFPYTVKSLMLQVKKITGGSVQINRKQYEKLIHNNNKDSAYLFYDMDTSRLCSPMVNAVDNNFITKGYEECQKKSNESFNLSFDHILDDGHPLSLFLLDHLIYGKSIGSRHNSFRDAFEKFDDISHNRGNSTDFSDFNGRLAIVSLGKPIKYAMKNNETFNIDV